MAEEAFALSPISARAALPGEGDYAAIREAFMETARGRWFLSEYAKRNRNTDTTMVLDAVARIEANLAAQKRPPPVGLTESLGAIRSAIRDAKVIAAEAMPRTDLDGVLVAALNGARIIREIAWTLRECGADARICDLLDTQIKAIGIGQQQITDLDSRGTVLATFDGLVQRIEELATGNAASATPDPATPADSVLDAAAEKHEASITPLFRTATEAAAAQTSAIAETSAGQDAAEMLATISADLASDLSSDVVSGDIDTIEFDAEAAEDDAVLDIIATEMAASDFAEPDYQRPAYATPDVALAEKIAPAMAEPPTMAGPDAVELIPAPASLAHPIAPVGHAAIVEQQSQAQRQPLPSLGAALIASGMVTSPGAPASDPLAPIRRMSQAEKIAFFS